MGESGVKMRTREAESSAELVATGTSAILNVRVWRTFSHLCMLPITVITRQPDLSASRPESDDIESCKSRFNK